MVEQPRWIYGSELGIMISCENIWNCQPEEDSTSKQWTYSMILRFDILKLMTARNIEISCNYYSKVFSWSSTCWTWTDLKNESLWILATGCTAKSLRAALFASDPLEPKIATDGALPSEHQSSFLTASEAFDTPYMIRPPQKNAHSTQYSSHSTSINKVWPNHLFKKEHPKALLESTRYFPHVGSP